MNQNAGRTLITGATGLVGKKIVQRLGSAVVTTRKQERAKKIFPHENVEALEWKQTSVPPDLGSCGTIDAVINLMGESIASGRWTDEKKKRIRDSRVIGTRSLVDAIGKMERPPKVLVSASAVGFYGDCGDQMVDESNGPGDGFLADVCRQWEEASLPVEDFGVRLVNIRIGIVLAKENGALAKMLPIFKLGLGGKLGNGQQYFPWIHIDDLVALTVWLVNNESATGAFNATAPNPVTNADFTKSLAQIMKRPAFFAVPKFALKIAAGEFAESLLESQNAFPKAAVDGGFRFKFTNVCNALSNLLR